MSLVEDKAKPHMTDDSYLEAIMGVSKLFPAETEDSNSEALNSLDPAFNGAYRVDKSGLSGTLDCVDSVDELPETIRAKEPLSKEQLLFYFEVQFSGFDSNKA